MENFTVKNVEMKEYIANEGFVFKRVETLVNENGETIETPSFARKLFGQDVVIKDYEIVPETEIPETETPPM